MKLKALTAAIAATLSINAGAVVLTPSASGGSEFVLFVGGDYEAGTVQFSQDLGLQASNFDFTQSYSWKLNAGFNEFLNPARYDPAFTPAPPPATGGAIGCNGFSNGLICGNAPDPTTGVGDGQVRWGVVAAERATNASKVYVTWGAFNEGSDPLGDGDTNTNGYIPTLTATELADGLNGQWTAGTSAAIRELNERAAHANNANGADLYTFEGIHNDPNAPLGTLYGNPINPAFQTDASSSQSIFGARQFNLIDANLDLQATLDEQVTMYLYDEAAGPDAVAQGDGATIGKWFFDYANGWLVYEVAGSVVPAPVPVPAALWLLGSALIGLTGISRRRAV